MQSLKKFYFWKQKIRKITVIGGAYNDYIQVSYDFGNSFSNGSSISLSRAIAVSLDSKYITIAANGGILKSKDFGVSWVGITRLVGYGIAMSANGQYQTFAANGSFISVSSDFGETWTNKHVTRNWRCCDMSQSGQYQIVCGYSGTNMAISSDFGNTWSDVTGAGAASWFSVSISDNGQYITAIPYGGTIRVSNDFGATWSTKTSAGNKTQPSCAMSANGQYQTVTGNGVNIFRSTDYGLTWAAVPSSGNLNYNCVAMSADGRIQAAAVSIGFIYMSYDYGVTWQVKTAVAKDYQAIAIPR